MYCLGVELARRDVPCWECCVGEEETWRCCLFRSSAQGADCVDRWGVVVGVGGCERRLIYSIVLLFSTETGKFFSLLNK